MASAKCSNPQDVSAPLIPIKHNPKNKHDSYAIEVHTVSGQMLGHVPRSENRVLARLMDSGKRLTGTVKSADESSLWDEIPIKILMTNI